MKTPEKAPVVQAAKAVDAAHHTVELSRKNFAKKKAEADKAFQKLNKDELSFKAAKENQTEILMKLL